MVTHHPKDGQPPSPGQLPTVPCMVTYHPPTIHRKLNRHSKDQGRSPRIPRMVNHYVPTIFRMVNQKWSLTSFSGNNLQKPKKCQCEKENVRQYILLK